MSGETVLVVDDEPSILEVVELYLRQEGFRVVTAPDGPAALQAARRQRPDLVVLDLMLPGMSGLEVCRTLRGESTPPLPVIMLTARGSETDRVVGLELGADDYVVKPFSPRELVARVKAVLRRTTPPPAASGTPALTFGDLRIEPTTRQVTLEGKPVILTAREFDLLHFLAQHPNQVFTRDQLMDHVWGYEVAGDTSTVTVHVRRLREKIEADPTHPQHVLTVWGVGYKFDPS
ncbi:MAG: response regulator transcription factor [Anaerolineae bacterium]|nr:response regulator transcription factor [Anaerolineae bacterium]